MIEIILRGGPPPPPPTRYPNAGLYHIAPLIFAILLYVTVALFMWMRSKGRTFEIRRIGALDAIDGVVGRATEMNRPLVFIPFILGDVGSPVTPPVMSVFSYICRLCAKSNTKLFVPLDQGWNRMYAWLDDTAKSSYLAEGHPERYDSKTIQFMGEVHAWSISTLGWIADNKPAGLILLGEGHAWTRYRFPEETVRYGGIGIGGTVNEPEFGIFFDYFLLGEEVQAAGAYVSKDPDLLVSVASADYLKIGIVLAALIIAIGTVAGVPIASWITGAI